ncbi:hypothetical protein SynBIOSE41_00981 [Synechococcus sp. BIOS-E4-1]|nr:hypothetical protein SynBIOSE41_00981 [Synechococcus sp. BIOS-E4-1]
MIADLDCLELRFLPLFRRTQSPGNSERETTAWTSGTKNSETSTAKKTYRSDE